VGPPDFASAVCVAFRSTSNIASVAMGLLIELVGLGVVFGCGAGSLQADNAMAASMITTTIFL
jgi:hypothetical protein